MPLIMIGSLAIFITSKSADKAVHSAEMTFYGIYMLYTQSLITRLMMAYNNGLSKGD